MNLKKEIKNLLTKYLEDHIDEFNLDDVRLLANNTICEWPN